MDFEGSAVHESSYSASMNKVSANLCREGKTFDANAAFLLLRWWQDHAMSLILLLVALSLPQIEVRAEFVPVVLSAGGEISPFAPKAYKPGEKGWATPEDEFLPGEFVGWDPKSGAPVMLDKGVFKAAGRILATVPNGYEVTSRLNPWNTETCYRTGVNGSSGGVVSWDYRTEGVSRHATFVTKSGNVRAIVERWRPPAPGKKGGSGIREYDLLADGKLQPLIEGGELAAFDYRLETFIFETRDAASKPNYVLVSGGTKRSLGYEGGGNFYFTKDGLVIPGEGTLKSAFGGPGLVGQDVREMSEGFTRVPAVRTGDSYSAILPDGKVVKGQKFKTDEFHAGAYGRLLANKLPVLLRNEHALTIGIGDLSAAFDQGAMVDGAFAVDGKLPSNDSFVAAVGGKIVYWEVAQGRLRRFENNAMVWDVDLGVKEPARFAGVSPSVRYAVVVQGGWLFLCDLERGGVRRIALKPSTEGLGVNVSVAFTGDDVAFVREKYLDESYRELYVMARLDLPFLLKPL